MKTNKIKDLESKLEALKKHEEFIGLKFIIRDTKNMTPKNRVAITKSIERKATYMLGQYLEFVPVIDEFEYLLRKELMELKKIERCKQ